jgi:hypothetical protein
VFVFFLLIFLLRYQKYLFDCLKSLFFFVFINAIKDLRVFLDYLDEDLLNPAMEIDCNLFNTEADYFVLVDSHLKLG